MVKETSRTLAEKTKEIFMQNENQESPISPEQRTELIDTAQVKFRGWQSMKLITSKNQERKESVKALVKSNCVLHVP